jgi:beta-N-acetylhexosaminidase
MHSRRWFNLLLILAVLLAVTNSAAVPGAAAQGTDTAGEEAFIAGLIPRMSPEAKVGQLFVVSFDGTDVSAPSDVADLILNYRVGGVILSAEQGNIVNTVNTPAQVTALSAALQNLSRQTARVASPSPFIPLFMALEQDGDGAPASPISSGLTPAPSYMAIGATWQTAHAEATGGVVGQELSALGINLLLGPSLDVRMQSGNSAVDPGVKVFGGDPYWVGALGQAYVRGLRAGSIDRLAAVLKHFPGEGALNDETYTLDRSLDDLKKIDLSPFFRLMPLPTGKSRPLADALLTTNVRYRGYGGNIRERTKPMSVDSAALQTLLDLPEVKAWREAGGLMMSDVFGSTAVRDYYATTNSTPFSPTQVALETFQAGNDVLIVRGLTASTLEEKAAQTREIIRVFRQKYSTDPAFQARVDSAVQRILRLKYRLYPEFDVTTVAPPLDGVTVSVGGSVTTTLQVAADALTLLWPAPDQLTTAALPSPDDAFIIATDTRLITDCRNCVPRATLRTGDVAQAITRLYGVPATNITSTTFSDLKSFLTNAPDATDLLPAFERARWVVIAMQTIDAGVPSSDAARQLLALRPELLNGKRVIGLVFGPPHSLTAVELAQFTAVYALYGKTPPFVEVAVRALAGDAAPNGRSPISVPALGYDLTRQTEPEPSQLIQLTVGDEVIEGQPTPPPLRLRAGDTAKIRTGTIMDRNGHAVPDGTPVRFQFQYADAAAQVHWATTVSGVARAEFVLDRVGQLLIRAASEPALASITLQITINDAGAIVATLPPVPTATPTRLPTITPTASSTPTVTPTPTPGFMQMLLQEKPQHARWTELILALLGAVVVGGSGYWRMQAAGHDRVRALRVGLLAMTGALIAYAGLGLSLPGTDWLRTNFGAWAALIVALIGGTLLLVWAEKRSEQ